MYTISWPHPLPNTPCISLHPKIKKKLYFAFFKNILFIYRGMNEKGSGDVVSALCGQRDR